MHISYGIIPIYMDKNGSKQYLLLQSHEGYWGFPKGHSEGNETPQQTAVREAYEESGITVNESSLGVPVQYEYEQTVNSSLHTKRIVLYPVFITSQAITMQPEEIASYEWANFDRAISLINLPSVMEPLSLIENR